MKSTHTINEILEKLDDIIRESKNGNNPSGYFAALYRKVTLKVKQGIEEGIFDDGPRMEQLDIVFASRYIDAYNAYQKSRPVTKSWEKAFDLSKRYWPIVLQHLLIGMNAHINLDLGIAAAEVMKGKDINSLKGDFDKINAVLSSLVHEVQSDLAKVWPRLKKILKWTGKADDFLVDFSMKMARDGAWNFAVEYAKTPEHQQATFINTRDESVAAIGNLIINPGWLVSILFKVIRLGETGSISKKIKNLKE